MAQAEAEDPLSPYQLGGGESSGTAAGATGHSSHRLRSSGGESSGTAAGATGSREPTEPPEVSHDEEAACVEDPEDREKVSVREESEEGALDFLQREEHQVDLQDPEVRKTGCMRPLKHGGEKRRNSQGGKKGARLQCWQSLVGFIVYSWPVQSFVFCVVLFDMILTGMTFGNALPDVDGERHVLYEFGDIFIVCILAADVCLRWFAEGVGFILPVSQCKMNIFEAVLVPITIAEVTFLADMDLPLPLLRALRPILRGVRLVRVLIRTAGKGQEYLKVLRHKISGERLRYMQDGFDLDLQYITPQIVVMADPSIGREALLRNPLREVARFLNEKHSNDYLLLNVTEGRKYSTLPFFGRYYHFAMMQDSIPTLEGLMEMVQALDEWLRADEQHVVAVHSKHNQGRVAMIVIALMLYRKEYRSAASAMHAFEHHRKKRDNQGLESLQTLDSASQTRFLEYFAQMCSLRSGLPTRAAKITRIQLTGLPNAHMLDISCFQHPGEISKKRVADSCLSLDGAPHHQMSALQQSGLDSELLSDLANEHPENLKQAVLHAIEERSADSKRSGAHPLHGLPVFSSKQEHFDGNKLAVKTMKNSDGIAVARVWEVQDIEFEGALRVEVHVQGEDEDEADHHHHHRERRWLCCCRRRDRNEEAMRKMPAGMIFGCWLHTSLLEQDESKGVKHGKRGTSHRLHVDLDRFAVDKAAHAPSLRSLSSAMKLEIDFLVEHRVHLQDLHAEQPELTLVTSDVNMSESESLHWLTWVSERVWPKFKAGFTKMISDSIEDARSGLPGPLKSLQLASCSFGDAFPKFGPICACSRNSLNAHDQEQLEVELDIGLAYSTATNIRMEVGLFAFGISQIKISGVLSLKFTPLLDEIPVFSAMQMFFLNSPDVDLHFTNHLEVANTSFILDTIRNKIHDAIDGRLVLPNVLNINWADPSNDDAVTWPTLMPAFVVRVTLHRARGLQSSSSVLSREPDSFARLSIGGGHQHVRTPSVKGSNPIWSSSFDFVIYDARQNVDIKVFDTDFTGTSWLIGKLQKTPVSKLVEEGKDMGMWRKLEGGAPRAHSEVFLKARVFNLIPDPSTLPKEVHESQRPASDLPMTARNISMNSFSYDNMRPMGHTDGPHDSSKTLCQSELPGEEGEDEEEDDEEALEQEELEAAKQQSAGAVALLVCTVLGGQFPAKLGKASDFELKVTFGSASISEACKDPVEGATGILSEKTQKSIGRLAERGLSADEIAKALDEDFTEVVRALRRNTMNMDVQQKICLHLKLSDFIESAKIHFCIVGAKKKAVSEGTLPVSKLLGSTKGKHDGEVVCTSTGRGKEQVKLDLDLRLYTLQAQEDPVEHSHTRSGRHADHSDGGPLKTMHTHELLNVAQGLSNLAQGAVTLDEDDPRAGRPRGRGRAGSRQASGQGSKRGASPTDPTQTPEVPEEFPRTI